MNSTHTHTHTCTHMTAAYELYKKKLYAFLQSLLIYTAVHDLHNTLIRLGFKKCICIYRPANRC